MATLSELQAQVNVGETDVGEVYVGEVNIGEVTREVDVDIDVDVYLDACDSDEKQELLNLLSSDLEFFQHWLDEQPLADLQSIAKQLLQATATNDYSLSELMPDVVPETPAVQTAEERQEIQDQTENALNEISEIPPLDLIRQIATLRNIPPEQMRAFPRATISALCDKLIGASDPLVIYQVPPDLKTMIEALRPGEITEDFLQEMRLQIG